MAVVIAQVERLMSFLVVDQFDTDRRLVVPGRGADPAGSLALHPFDDSGGVDVVHTEEGPG